MKQEDCSTLIEETIQPELKDKVIYLLTNTITGQQYVGQTVDFYQRMFSHGSQSKDPTLLTMNIFQYGFIHFTKEILIENLTEYEANVIEMYYIDTLKCELNIKKTDFDYRKVFDKELGMITYITKDEYENNKNDRYCIGVSYEYKNYKHLALNPNSKDLIRDKPTKIKSSKTQKDYQRIDKVKQLKQQNEIVRCLNSNAQDFQLYKINNLITSKYSLSLNMSTNKSNFNTILTGFKSIKDMDTTKGAYQSVSDTVRQLKSWSINNILAEKEDGFLFNFADYSLEFGRTISNAVYSSAIVLDIDSGDLSREGFNKIFAKAGTNPLSHCFMNSASRKLGDENRLRSVIFTNAIMNQDVYKIMFKHIIKVLEQNGYYTIPLSHKEEFIKRLDTKFGKGNWKRSGLDSSKDNFSSCFYAPCTIIGREEYAFFSSFGVDNRAIKKNALDVESILKLSIVKETKVELEYEEEKIITQKDFKTTNQYRKVEVLLNQMVKGNRSYLATEIGGKIKYWELNEKLEMIQKCINKGIDKSAEQSLRRYAGL